MSVRITGPVLSALLYEHSSADNDLEGLLLGTVTDVIKNTISDSSISNVESRTLYSIFSCIPCSFGLRWFDNTMKVNGESLKKLLNEHSKTEIVGWFKLRRNSSLHVSMKERSISKNLLKWLQEHGGYKRRDMVFMLCVSQYTNNTALYICDHQFMKYDRDGFVTIPEKVTNLAETARASYCPPTGSVTSADSCYNLVLEKFKPTFFDEKHESAVVGEIRLLSAKLHSKLKSLSRSVEESEHSVAQEMAEILSLQKRIAENREDIANVKLLISSSSETEVESEPEMLTNVSSDETVDGDIIDDLNSEINTDLLMDADDVSFPEPILTPSVVTLPISKPTSLLDDVQLSESPTDIFTSETLRVDEPIMASAECFSAPNCVQPKSSVVTVKPEPLAAKAEEPFSFVSNLMMSYASPTKKPASDAERRNKRPLNP